MLSELEEGDDNLNNMESRAPMDNSTVCIEGITLAK